MPDVRTVEFNSLPKSVRERFVAITIGTGGPAPLLSERTSTNTKILGLSFLAAVLAILVVAMVGAGIGSLWNNLAIHRPLHVLFGYVPLVFVLVFVILVIVQRKVVGSPLPFQPGRYLFATDFVDARTGTLRIIPTKDLSDFKGTHMHTNNAYTHTQLNFVFGNVTEQFVVRGQEAAQTAINAFWDSQKALSAAAQAQDWPAIEKVDPFLECRRLGAWGSATPQPADDAQVKAVPPFFRRRAVIAAVVAIVLSPLIALGRNFVSDEMMFANAKNLDTESSYGQYLDNGWRHISEAKLAQPIAAFREAKKDATVSKMRRVLKTYPGSSVESDVRAALHGLYMKTFSDFRARASTADARMLPFMARLIDYLEKNDTATVRVVFSPPSTGTLAQADAFFRREFSRGGKIVEPISPYFEPKNSSPREGSIVSRLNAAFASIFPTDVLKLEQAVQGATSAKEPSISIAYVVGPSGRAYNSDDGQRVFVGIDVAFGMRMRIPNDSNPFDFNLKVSPPERFGYRVRPGASQAEAAYNAMAERAFDEFTTKLQGVFFRNPPAAATGPR